MKTQKQRFIPHIVCLGRVNIDGALDLGFSPEPNAAVYPLLVQPDGKILVGGSLLSNLVTQILDWLRR